MENKNVLTINFNNTEDLAIQIAEWNYILNHECCGNCHDEKHSAEQVAKAMCETAPKAEPATKQEKQKTPEITDDDIQVLYLDADPSPKAEAQPRPAVQEKTEPVTESESALDVSDKPVDKKTFYKEFRAWMGADAAKAKKAIAIFGKHGVSRPSSDSLTDDLITDLKSIMAEEA